MKTVLLINPKKANFTQRIEDYFNACNQHYLVTYPDEMCVLINQDEASLYVNSEKVDTSLVIPFVRLGGIHTHFVSFLYQCAEVWNWDLNDMIRLSSDVVQNKPSQILACYKNNLPFPTSMVVTAASVVKSKLLIEQIFGYPFVLKGYGSRGLSVYKINDFEELDAIDMNQDVTYLIQEYIENSFDVRVLVYQGRVIGGMKRESDTFLNNYSQGGAITPYHPTELEKEISIKMCQAMNVTFGGVDIMLKDNKPVIIEVNLAPQTKGFEMTNKGIDVVHIIGEDLVKRARKSD